MNEETWGSRLRAGSYAASDALETSNPVNWAVEGYLPSVGTTVWFGSGATGKTQLLLTLAAAIAKIRSGPDDQVEWLGATVKANGHVLVLSAEDLRNELLRRLTGIVRDLDIPADAKTAMCSRIHIVPFLSLSKEEFPAANPCLFEMADRVWSPTTTLKEIEGFIEDWNSAAPEGERIVAVIMDSSTTMAGFDANNSEGATNFLFYLNRLCVRLGVSWSIIGHTQKETKVDPYRPQENAIARLRGSAMWSTTPRSVVEVRLAHPDEDLGDITGVDLRDLVVVTVAKANNFEAERASRYLLRKPGAGYDDITALGPKSPSISSDLSKQHRDRLAEVLRMLRDLVERRQTERLSPRLLTAEFEKRQCDIAAFDGMGSSANDKPEKTARGSLSWCLHQFEKQGAVRYRDKGYDVLDLELAEVNLSAA